MNNVSKQFGLVVRLSCLVTHRELGLRIVTSFCPVCNTESMLHFLRLLHALAVSTFGHDAWAKLILWTWIINHPIFVSHSEAVFNQTGLTSISAQANIPNLIQGVPNLRWVLIHCCEHPLLLFNLFLFTSLCF